MALYPMWGEVKPRQWQGESKIGRWRYSRRPSQCGSAAVPNAGCDCVQRVTALVHVQGGSKADCGDCTTGPPPLKH